MNDLDLPEPATPTLTHEDMLARHGRTFRAFCYFVTAYALVHKLFVPLVLSRTALRSSPYALVDFWFIHPLAFSFCVWRWKESRLCYLLAGIGVVYAGFEIFEILQGRFPGWLSISRFLSSFPMGLVCLRLIFPYDESPHTNHRSWVVGGMALFLFYAGVREAMRNAAPMAEAQSPTAVFRSLPHLRAVSACGLTEFQLEPKDLATLPRAKVIHVQGCGFTVGAVIADDGAFEIANDSGRPLNVHYLESTAGGGQRGEWNFVVAAGARVTSPRIHPSLGRVGMIYSDSSPQAGIVAVVPAGLSSTWEFGRQPLRVREITR